ncbi:hypothetical protein DNJ73_04100 [Prochlorococcus marinus XMU1408]|uniref:N-acetyltransferase domain-containing protein n=2 Tax=Prochlorococcus marinus TaxID=1219 RepID=A0A318R760_PROMR|nr:hypothetical protein [Prochlorococcus marinus str. XMU1408]PYE03281.1 hypothetical protein DNJ73_04100 [Prochlorococcus marinus XMU1408]
MLKECNKPKYLGIFQILLCKKWFSSLESNLTNIIPTRNSTCFVAIERNNIIAYILATPINKRGSCWSISEPYFIGESISYSRYNLLENLLRKILYESNINTQSFLISVNTNDNQNLSIIRQSGFQPFKIIKYWKRRDDLKYIKNEYKQNFIWERLNEENSQLIWRLEQARESINFRSIFDRQWHDIYEKRNILTGVIKCQKNNVIAGLIPSICPQYDSSLELIRGLAWDERLNQSIPQRINNFKLTKNNYYIETTSEDNKLNEIMSKSNWVTKEERVLLGRSIWKRQNGYKFKSIETELLTNLVGNLQQQPELPSTFQIKNNR